MLSVYAGLSRILYDDDGNDNDDEMITPSEQTMAI